ncbi:hypothetical protein WSK_1096 [Novosphingobium sp. Rr 2-17]|uniref:DUF1178 family protein n=1 Tax=Novosphingobium sp. Rr 2-17 TaxID=555793 RepID=UPI000269A19D|nr:DUF1178 family protein [Novosphingobium sp. Rr 2-17]EIZ80304.1 hypothetical protein WSK_1096 [Novosphingobium sp. Rr 2-17]
MIVFDLDCHDGPHRFEGWFKSSDDFAEQQARGLMTCPLCGSGNVAKAIQAPKLARKGNQLPAAVPASAEVPHPSALPGPPAKKIAPAHGPVAAGPLPPQMMELAQKLAQVQAEALKSSRWVGKSFAEDARAMHYGERDAEIIHGQATIAEAQELAEEGIAVMPLPFPVAPPDQAN